jgi:hypothetical protein
MRMVRNLSAGLEYDKTRKPISPQRHRGHRELQNIGFCSSLCPLCLCGEIGFLVALVSAHFPHIIQRGNRFGLRGEQIQRTPDKGALFGDILAEQSLAQ